MQIKPCDSSELANHAYVQIQKGIYSHEPTGRVLFVEPDDSALLVIRNAVASEAVAKP